MATNSMTTPNYKVGLGLITCDRVDFFKKSSNSLFKLDCIKIVVDDSENRVETLLDKIYTDKPKSGVGKAKNLALNFLLKQGCEHIFLMEDDVEILDEKVFELYINASKATGIKHFNYGLHGNHNLDYLGRPNIRKTINYPNNTRINLYPNVLGAFSYYHKDVLNKVGLMDENFYNALEHVDHTYQIIKEGFHPPFRWFADVEGSKSYLRDIVPDHQQSKIRSEKDFENTFKKGLDYFIKKNNFSVVQGYGPSETISSEKETLECLKNIWKHHHQK
jgi:hypothetical protein